MQGSVQCGTLGHCLILLGLRYNRKNRDDDACDCGIAILFESWAGSMLGGRHLFLYPDRLHNVSIRTDESANGTNHSLGLTNDVCACISYLVHIRDMKN